MNRYAGVSIVAALLILAGYFAYSRFKAPGGEPAPGNPPVPVPAEKAKAISQNDRAPSLDPVRCPVAKPEHVPGPLNLTFADPGVTAPSKIVDELTALAKTPKDEACANALRWLIFQQDRGEVVRNETLVVLGAWDIGTLVGDLEAMLFNGAHSETWRAYCVQHLKHHHAKHRDEASYRALEKAARAQGQELASVRETAIYSMACLSKELAWARSDAAKHESTLAFLDGALGAAAEPGTKVAAIRGLALLERKDRAADLEQWAGDETTPLEVRVAAVQALGPLSRPESRPILEICSRSEHKVLAQAAATAMKAQQFLGAPQ